MFDCSECVECLNVLIGGGSGGTDRASAGLMGAQRSLMQDEEQTL